MKGQGQENHSDLPDQARLTTKQGNQTVFSKMKQTISSFLVNTLSRFFPVNPSSLFFSKDKSINVSKAEPVEPLPLKTVIREQPLVVTINQIQRSPKRVKFLNPAEIEEIKQAGAGQNIRKKVKQNEQIARSNEKLTRISYANFLEYKSTELQYHLCQKLILKQTKQQQEQKELKQKMKHSDKRKKIAKHQLRRKGQHKDLRRQSLPSNVQEEQAAIEPFSLKISQQEALNCWDNLIYNHTQKKKKEIQERKRTKQQEDIVDYQFAHQERTFSDEKVEAVEDPPNVTKILQLPKYQIIQLVAKIEKERENQNSNSQQDVNTAINTTLLQTSVADVLDKDATHTPLKDTVIQYPTTPSKAPQIPLSPASVETKVTVSPSVSKTANPFIKQAATPPPINLQALVSQQTFPIFNQPAPVASSPSSLIIPNPNLKTTSHIFSNLNAQKSNLFTNTISPQNYQKIEEEPAYNTSMLNIPHVSYQNPPVHHNYIQSMNIVPAQNYFIPQQPLQQTTHFVPTPPVFPQFISSTNTRQSIEFNCFLQPQPTTHQSLFSQESRPQRNTSQPSKGKKTQRIM